MPCRFDAPSARHERFRRLPRIGAPGSSLVSASLATSNARHLIGSTSSALHEAGPSLLRPRLTSATTLTPLAKRLAQTASSQTSQGKTRDFPPIHPPHIQPSPPDDIGLRVYWPSRPENNCLVCGSWSSDREFACCFLPIPSRERHRCSSARSSCHRGLHRDSHPTSHFLARFRSPVIKRHLRDASRHA
jgi:hypothetical protein